MGDWRLQLFSIQHIFCFDMRNFRFGRAIQKSCSYPAQSFLCLHTRFARCPLFFTAVQYCTVAVLLAPQQFSRCSSRPFELFAPITTAMKSALLIHRRCDKIKSAPMCVGFKPIDMHGLIPPANRCGSAGDAVRGQAFLAVRNDKIQVRRE